jgi:hypothetical protein
VKVSVAIDEHKSNRCMTPPVEPMFAHLVTCQVCSDLGA